jgi:hypothetical protein
MTNGAPMKDTNSPENVRVDHQSIGLALHYNQCSMDHTYTMMYIDSSRLLFAVVAIPVEQHKV